MRNSKLTNRQLNELVKYFALEVPAARAAKVMGINRHSAERVYQVIRRCVARECELHSPLGGEVECDESYFGGRRKGPRGRGAAGKVPVFGLLKRNGKVYTRIVKDVSRKTLRQIIRTKVVPESVIYTDSFRSYDGLVLDGFKHYRINQQECFATSRRQHINGIENFWGYAKTKLKSYYGINRNQFYFYLKEMEFRFNHRRAANLAALIKKIVRKHEAVLD
ncbi:MAG: IS1595 family transposase [Acidobacteria bacterium]|nr:IS1595 family transposase [Acidobacteriota bacterium]